MQLEGEWKGISGKPVGSNRKEGVWDTLSNCDPYGYPNKSQIFKFMLILLGMQKVFQYNNAINNVKAFAQIIKAYFIYFSEYNFLNVCFYWG